MNFLPPGRVGNTIFDGDFSVLVLAPTVVLELSAVLVMKTGVFTGNSFLPGSIVGIKLAGKNLLISSINFGLIALTRLLNFCYFVKKKLINIASVRSQ